MSKDAVKHTDCRLWTNCVYKQCKSLATLPALHYRVRNLDYRKCDSKGHLIITNRLFL